MCRSALLLLLLPFGCGAEAGDSAASDVDGRDVAASGPSTPQAPLETSGAPEGQTSSDKLIIRGVATLTDSAPQGLDIYVGLDWVIEETLYPLNRTTGRAPLDGPGSGAFVLSTGERPLAAALVANEATNRDGVGVAYLTAFVDGDADGVLGCPDSECEDYRVGSSPNAMVVYAEEAWPAGGAALFDFNGAAGVRPGRGWSLVHFEHEGPEVRPTARDWTNEDAVELIIIGDYRERGRSGIRGVQLDVD